jgi:hypothetical protein
MSRSALAVVILLLSPAVLSADLLIVEKNVIAGHSELDSVRSTYIKGTRMRSEFVQGGQTFVTVYDLPAGEMLELEASKRKVNVRTVAARYAKLEKEHPRARATVSVTPAGRSQTIAGTSCDVHRFSIRVPMSSSGEIALTLDGAACLARQGAGVEDYQVFARAASERNVVIGQATDNYLLLALARAQTELYRALTALGGIPLMIELTSGVDGKGVLAGIARKPLEGARVTTVMRLDGAPQPDAMFAVPADWKRELKK